MKNILPLFFFPGLIWAHSNWISIGPMVHLNFGGGKTAFSLALELAYWSYPPVYESVNPDAEQGPYTGGPDGIGYGVDAAFEWEIRRGANKLRVYTEPQIGWDGLRGISLGPVLEIPLNKNPVLFGIQGSTWAGFLLGADIRLRYIDSKTFICPGLSGKIPLPAD